MITVLPFKLPLVNHPSAVHPLYPHQANMFEAWEEHQTFLLAAKTGTGKTRAALLPVFKRREWAVAVYPTNELLKDQVRAAARFAEEEDIPSVIWMPDIWKTTDRIELYNRAGHILIPIDGSLLDEWQTVMSCRSRGETLRRLLDPDKPKIVFTNPDILFLILSLHYHAEPFEALRRYESLVLDEFHLYQGVELAHALAMIALARGFGIFRRLVLLSATPHPEVQMLLNRAIQPTIIESGVSNHASAATHSRIAVHAVELTPIQLVGTDPIDMLVSQIVSLKPELERLRSHTSGNDYIPAVVIVNSVLAAIRLEDRLVQNGYERESLAIIRGLSHRAIRDTSGKLLAIGTAAIEVGVDFHCDYVIFEAYEASSFLQRFGRAGRHRPGKAIVFVPPNVFQGMSTLPQEVDRAFFEERVYSWYPAATTRPWFVTTEYGLITARALAESLIATVEKDRKTRPDVLDQLRARIEAVLSEYADRLGCHKQNLRAKGMFERCAAGKKTSKWLKVYCCLNRFRTSLPSIRIHDFMEQSRRGNWKLGEYDIDLATLLRRGKNVCWNEKLGMVTINGIGKYCKVHASEIFDDYDCEVIHETTEYPQLRLFQDGVSTSVSDLMSSENHIFTVVPKGAVQSELDWRIAVFEAGQYLIAFDGTALLLLEIYKQTRK